MLVPVGAIRILTVVRSGQENSEGPAAVFVGLQKYSEIPLFQILLCFAFILTVYLLKELCAVLCSVLCKFRLEPHCTIYCSIVTLCVHSLLLLFLLIF